MLRVSSMAAAVLAAAGAAFAQLPVASEALSGNVFEFRYSDVPLSGRLIDSSARGTVNPLETYTARLLGQSSASAFFLDTGTAPNYLFDSLPSAAGTHLAGAGALSTTEAIIPLSANEFEIVVQLSSDDGSDLFPAGLTGGTPALPITQLRFDVGMLAAGNDPIVYDSSDSHAFLFEAGLRVFADGVNIFETTFGDPPVSSPGSISLSQAWILNGAAGAGIDAVQTFWRVRDVPAPGSAALLAAAGALVLRRRR